MTFLAPTGLIHSKDIAPRVDGLRTTGTVVGPGTGIGKNHPSAADIGE